MRTQPSAATIAAMILTAPAWARIGIGVRDRHLRERAAVTVAEAIVAGLDAPEANADPRQLALALAGLCLMGDDSEKG